MHLEPTDTGFQIDATDLGPLLGVDPAEVPHLMRDGRITGLSEEGRDEDAGRFRVTFRYGAIRVRFTVDRQGEVLLRTRTKATLRPGLAPEPAPGYPAGG